MTVVAPQPVSVQPLELPRVTHGHRTLAAIMLTDAVGFSARMSVNEELTLAQLQRDQALMEQLCEQFEGKVLKSTGDGLLMYFASAVQAVSCGLEIQRALARLKGDGEDGGALLHRIGIHLGDVFFSQSDVMGNGVNIAARLQTEAHPSGICISKIVYDVVKARLDLDVTYAGPLQLKNIQELVPAYHVNIFPESPQGDGPGAAEPEPVGEMAGDRNPLAPGTRVGGRYVVQRVLGQGGFGRSYLVEDAQRFGEACVLKEFFPTKQSGKTLQKALDLFKREAKTLYQLNHPQVPKFLACFTQKNRLFIVQEFIDGVPYSQLLRQRRQQNLPFSEAEVVQWLRQMLQVLDYLHGLNLVHRDISPDNIMYCRDRNLPVLIDFGLVSDALNTLLSGQVTAADGQEAQPATMVGKFGYSPPEQIHLGQCFPSSDLYALGVTAIVLLTGRYPRDLIDRESLEWGWQAYASVSAPLEAILTRMVQQRPRDRFQSASAVVEHLAQIPSAPVPSAPVPSAVLHPPGSEGPARRGQGAIAPPLEPPDPAFIAACRQELMRCIGPMASVLVEEMAEQHPHATPEEFVEILASQLSNGAQATAFIGRLQSVVEETASASAIADSDAKTQPEPPTQPAAPAGLSPEFLSRCRQTLTHCVGPMASYLIDDVLGDFPHLSAAELVARLAAEIPDPKKAAAFRQQMQ